MKTKADYLAANARLATALGWTKIVDVGNALLGKPDWVCDNSRDQVQVPDWCGQWSACGPLLAQGIDLTFYLHGVTAAFPQNFKGETPVALFAEFKDHQTREHAVRYAVTMVLICRYQNQNQNQVATS